MGEKVRHGMGTVVRLGKWELEKKGLGRETYHATTKNLTNVLIFQVFIVQIFISFFLKKKRRMFYLSNGWSLL